MGSIHRNNDLLENQMTQKLETGLTEWLIFKMVLLEVDCSMQETITAREPITNSEQSLHFHDQPNQLGDLH